MEPIIQYKPIGIIHTPFNDIEGMPIQPSGSGNAKGYIELQDEYVPGLFDLEGFSHIILIYHLHKVLSYKLYVVPFIDDKPHGIFATRAPARPNPIGISTVRITSIEKNIIHLEDVDMLNETPLLDIKPFYPKYDNRENVKYGWLEAKENVDIEKIKSDNRFVDSQADINRCNKNIYLPKNS